MFKEWATLAERAVKALEAIAAALVVRSGATQPDPDKPADG